jgi:hypothetical protein
MTLTLLAGLGSMALAQEQGTPPVTVVTVPVPSTPMTTVVDQPATTQQAQGSGVQSPGQETTTSPTAVTPVEGRAADGRAYIWWVGALAGLGMLFLGRWFIVSRQPEDEPEAFEALGIIVQGTGDRPDSLFVLREGPFSDLEAAIEAAMSNSVPWTPPGVERRLWWIIRAMHTGDVFQIVGPVSGPGDEGQSRAKLSRLLVDLTHESRTTRTS